MLLFLSEKFGAHLMVAAQPTSSISDDGQPFGQMHGIARERIPKDPVFSLATFARSPKQHDNIVSCVLDAGTARFVGRGCAAIGLALQHAKIGQGDQVLIPAYHCISMVEPVVWRGAVPAFYRVNADTSVNLQDIEARISEHTRALLVPHYFGFPQKRMVEVRALCEARKLVLIEDCAHAFFGSVDQAPLGSFGDYAIASVWKFFPSPEGGLLISSRKNLKDIVLQKPGIRFQVKTLVNSLEHAIGYRRLRYFGLLLRAPLMVKDVVLRFVKRLHGEGASSAKAATQATSDTQSGHVNWGFDSATVSRKMCTFSHWVASRASRSRIVDGRRANYARLLTEFERVPGCRPLFPTLPAGVVPHVFPLLIDDPESVFGKLKDQGVPIIRFGEFLWPAMSNALCNNSMELSRRVFQFPCHQDLWPEELEWMIGCIKSALHQLRFGGK